MNKFWQVIDLLDWNSHFDVDITRDKLEVQTTMDLEEFHDQYRYIEMVVTGLIRYRLETSTLKMSKGKNRSHSDDYMFMDLPAHIIANGEKYCTAFINKNATIDFEAVECFAYGLLSEDEELETIGA